MMNENATTTPQHVNQKPKTKIKQGAKNTT
jgi:hypothetical protein